MVDQLFLEQFIAALDFLTENEKFVIEAAVANWPTRMIARELGITETAVRHIKSRARQKIKGRGELQDFIRFVFSFDAVISCVQLGLDPRRVSKKERALFLLSGILIIIVVIILRMIIGLYQFLRRMLAKFHTKKLRE